MAVPFFYSNPSYSVLLSSPGVVQELNYWWVTASLLNLNSTSSFPDSFKVLVRQLLATGEVNTAVPEKQYTATYASMLASNPNDPAFIKVNIKTGLTTGVPYRIQIQDYKSGVLRNTITIPRHTFTAVTNNISWASGGVTVASAKYELSPALTFFDPLSGTMKTAGSRTASINPISSTSYNSSSSSVYTTTPEGDVVTFANLSKRINLNPGKSYLTLSNESAKAKRGNYNLAFKQFSAITTPAEELVTITGSGGMSQLGIIYPGRKCYSFGTSLSLNNASGSEMQGAGLGFFVNNVSGDGYYLIVETTAAASSQDRRSIRIVRVKNSQIKVLTDSQTDPKTTYDIVTGGTTYNIDIKVEVLSQEINIKATINGFNVTAKDTTVINTTPKSGGLYEILKPTEYIALVCFRGKVAFDYAYASNILTTQYDDSTYFPNFYQGQFGNDLINSSYGDLQYLSNYSSDEISAKGLSFDEFGTVAREIVVAKAKFDNPSYPIGWVVGNDLFAKVIGSKINNFGAEAYVLNNSSTTIPLEDGNNSSFYLYGNNIGQSGTIEYVSNEIPENITPEPVIFESKWIQNLSDVELLGQWIKSKVSTVSKIVTMKIFGNPLISVGDIVTINYTYQGFNGTQKLIITSVNHSYSEGLETTVTCRTL